VRQPPVPWRDVSSGLLVRVRLTPKSSSDAVGGLCDTADGPALKARVRAVPADGKANEALLRLFADVLGVPRTTVLLASGATSRVKSVVIAGSAGDLTKALRDLASR
jgi:uncharacterized protein (TIGR00251 family)